MDNWLSQNSWIFLWLSHPASRWSCASQTLAGLGADAGVQVRAPGVSFFDSSWIPPSAHFSLLCPICCYKPSNYSGSHGKGEKILVHGSQYPFFKIHFLSVLGFIRKCSGNAQDERLKVHLGGKVCSTDGPAWALFRTGLQQRQKEAHGVMRTVKSKVTSPSLSIVRKYILSFSG